MLSPAGKKIATDLNGIFAVLKPIGISSAKVVAEVKSNILSQLAPK